MFFGGWMKTSDGLCVLIKTSDGFLGLMTTSDDFLEVDEDF